MLAAQRPAVGFIVWLGESFRRTQSQTAAITSANFEHIRETCQISEGGAQLRAREIKAIHRETESIARRYEEPKTISSEARPKNRSLRSLRARKRIRAICLFRHEAVSAKLSGSGDFGRRGTHRRFGRSF